MFGKSMDLGAKREFFDAVVFYFVHLVILAGLTTVAFHFLGQAGLVEAGGSFFEGGELHTLVGSLFVLWLGGSILAKRGMTNDIMSIAVVAVGVYLAWTMGIMIGLVPVALLTTMGK